MDESHPTDISVKDLMCYVLKQYRTIAIIAMIFALLAAVVGIKLNSSKSSVESADIMDASIQLPGETDETYANRVENIDRINTINENIHLLTQQIDLQNDYINHSLLMQLDPLNTACSQVQIVINCDEDTTGGVEALYDAYLLDLTTGIYLEPFATQYGYDIGALQELITCYEVSRPTDCSSSLQTQTVTLQVVGPTVDFTDEIINLMIAEIESQSQDFGVLVARHSVEVVENHSYVSYNSDVRTAQMNAIKLLNDLHSQINTLNSNLDNVAKNMGLKDRTSIFNYSVSSVNSQSSFSFADIVEYSVLGVFLSVSIVVMCLVVYYLIGSKIVSQAQFFSLFSRIEKIGVVKPLYKRSRFSIMLDCLSGDDYDRHRDNNRIVEANYKNIVTSHNKILLTGTVDSNTAQIIKNNFDLDGDYIFDFFNSSAALLAAPGYDGIVLVEQRAKSKKNLIKEEIRLLENTGRPIVGAIII